MAALFWSCFGVDRFACSPAVSARCPSSGNPALLSSKTGLLLLQGKQNIQLPARKISAPTAGTTCSLLDPTLALRPDFQQGQGCAYQPRTTYAKKKGPHRDSGLPSCLCSASRQCPLCPPRSPPTSSLAFISCFCFARPFSGLVGMGLLPSLPPCFALVHLI